MKRVLSGLLLVLGFAGAAWSDEVIDFSGQGGTHNAITFNGTVGSNLVASGNIGSLDFNNGTPVAVTGGSFSLTIPVLSVTGTGTHRVYSLGSGGAFSITGAVPALGVASQQLVIGGSLATGGQIAAVNASSSSTRWNLTADGTDHKAPALLSALGVPNVLFIFSGITFNLAPTFGSVSGQPNSFTATAISTDVTNTATPEPGSIIMLGTVLAGVSTLLRRRVRAGSVTIA